MQMGELTNEFITYVSDKNAMQEKYLKKLMWGARFQRMNCQD